MSKNSIKTELQICFRNYGDIIILRFLLSAKINPSFVSFVNLYTMTVSKNIHSIIHHHKNTPYSMYIDIKNKISFREYVQIWSFILDRSSKRKAVSSYFFSRQFPKKILRSFFFGSCEEKKLD